MSFSLCATYFPDLSSSEAFHLDHRLHNFDQMSLESSGVHFILHPRVSLCELNSQVYHLIFNLYPLDLLSLLYNACFRTCVGVAALATVIFKCKADKSNL